MRIRNATLGRRRGLVIAASLGLLTSLLPGAGAFGSPAPLPPLDECLSDPTRPFSDSVCGGHWPAGAFVPYGTLGTVVPMLVGRNVEVTLDFPAGSALGTDQSVSCWIERGDNTFGNGITQVGPGCASLDLSCTLRYVPPFIGDAGEKYTVVFASINSGIVPVTTRTFALYSPPVLYPVRLDGVDTAGDPLTVSSSEVAYAVRPGANPVQADCVAYDWFVAVRFQPAFAAPACITFRTNNNTITGERWLEGLLPNDTGAWTMVSGPRGSASAPLRERPARYRSTTVTPSGDDIVTQIVREFRPILEVELEPETLTMEIGTTQTVDVVVRAVGGDAGSLRGLTFSSADIIVVPAAPNASLHVIGTVETIPAGGFSLARGAERKFQVQLRAIGVGRSNVGASVNGQDDLGSSVGDSHGGPIDVVYVPPPPPIPGGPAAPNPPVVQRALDLQIGAAPDSDVIQGYVPGAPGTTVLVTLASSATDPCSKQMNGASVTWLGTFPVTIAANGFGSFTHRRDVVLDRFVYGITVEGSLYSAVGDCRRVTLNLPNVNISNVTVTEGTGAGTTTATFTVSLTAASAQTVTVQATTANGTALGAIGAATAPADYASLGPVTLTFAPNETSKQVTVQVVRDALDEPDERFFLDLSNPVNAFVGISRGIGTILDDDVPPPLPSVRISHKSTTEGNGSGTKSVALTISLSTASSQAVTVRYGTANGTVAGDVKRATASDYVAVLASADSSLITFAPGETNKTIIVKIRKDSVAEPDERFFVNLSSPVNARLVAPNGTANDGQGIVIIRNDD